MAKTERSGHTTTDHDFIRQWVEERGGWPARVEGTGGRNDAGLIRIDFPGYSGEGSLERIEWEEWFESFDDNQLAFLHRDMDHGGGDLDRFNKLVRRSGSDDETKEPTRSGGSRGRSSVAASARRGGSTRKSSGGSSSRSTSSRSPSSSRSTASKSEGGSSSSRSGGSRSTTSRSTAAKSDSGSSRSSSTRSSGGSSSSRSSGGSTKSGSSSTRSSGGSASTGSRSRSTASRSTGSSSSRSNGTSSSRSTGTAARARSNGRGAGTTDTEPTELRELLKHELGDLYFAEKTFLKATGALVKEAQDPEVKARLEQHVRETEGQIERIKQAFASIGEKAKAETCEAALGLKEEHDSFKSDEKPSKLLLSAFDLGSGLRVEHYEIAAYRTTIAVANALGEKECANLLKESLREEMDMAAFIEKNALRVLKSRA